MEIKNKYNIGDTVYYGFGQRDDDNRYFEEPAEGKILGILVENQEIKYWVQTKYGDFGHPYFKAEDSVFNHSTIMSAQKTAAWNSTARD